MSVSNKMYKQAFSALADTEKKIRILEDENKKLRDLNARLNFRIHKGIEELKSETRHTALLKELEEKK